MRTTSHGDDEELASDILYGPTGRLKCLEPAVGMRPEMQVGKAVRMCEARVGGGWVRGGCAAA